MQSRLRVDQVHRQRIGHALRHQVQQQPGAQFLLHGPGQTDRQAQTFQGVKAACTFVGISIGAALGNALLTQAGWTGVTALAVIAALGALALRLRTPSQANHF